MAWAVPKRDGNFVIALKPSCGTMIIPGLISVAFYRRRPTTIQFALSLAFTIVVSGLLGYWQDYGTSRVWENTILAIIGGVILYVAILVYLVYWYLPRRARANVVPSTDPPTSRPPSV
jgi:hypothetical protein